MEGQKMGWTILSSSKEVLQDSVLNTFDTESDHKIIRARVVLVGKDGENT